MLVAHYFATFHKHLFGAHVELVAVLVPSCLCNDKLGSCVQAPALAGWSGECCVS